MLFLRPLTYLSGFRPLRAQLLDAVPQQKGPTYRGGQCLYYFHKGCLERNNVKVFVSLKAVIEESIKGRIALGMLLSSKRLITYVYPLLLRDIRDIII